MIKPDLAKWQQTLPDLQRLMVEAAHQRSRERFQALYMIASQHSNASEWARQIGRQAQTVMGWVHDYNDAGPTALHYRRSGGRPPFLPPSR
jgi:transposase